DLRAGDAEAAVAGALVAHVEGDVERRDVEVGEVDRDLRAAELGDHPADGLDRLEDARLPLRLALGVDDRVAVVVALHPPALADVEGDARGQALVEGVEVDVVGDEELARADDDRARARDELRGAEVGLPARVEQLLRAAFVFALADIREVAPVWRAAGVLVEENGDVELPSDALAEAAGQLDTVVHG